MASNFVAASGFLTVDKVQQKTDGDVIVSISDGSSLLFYSIAQGLVIEQAGSSYLRVESDAADAGLSVLSATGADCSAVITAPGSGNASIQAISNDGNASVAVSSDTGVAQFLVNSVQVVGAQQAAIPDSAGTLGADTTAINAILAALRAHGLIAT